MSRSVTTAIGPALPPTGVSASPGPSEAGSGSAKAQIDPRVWKSATDFEAMAIGQMLQPMFETLDSTGGFFGGGPGESNFRPMLVTEMAKAIERRGGLGLAPSVYQQMLTMQEHKR